MEQITYNDVHSADKRLSLIVDKLLEEINRLRETNGDLRMQIKVMQQHDPDTLTTVISDVGSGMTIGNVAKHLATQDELLSTAEIALRTAKNGAY